MKKNTLYIILLLTTVCACTVSRQPISQVVKPVADTNIILPPFWAFGVLYGGYTNQKETIERIDAIKDHDYPIDAYWIDSWFWDYVNKGRGPKKYIDFIADTISYPNKKAMWDHLQKNNVKGGFWVWDCIMQTGNEQAFKEFDQNGFFRNKYIETNPWHNNSSTTAMFESASTNKKGTLCGNIDFENPTAVGFFKQKMKHFFDEGVDFIKLDRTSAISVCKTMFEMSQELGKETKGRGFMLSHTGGQERPEYKRYPTKWTDDTRSDWNVVIPLIKFDSWVPNVALQENIAMFTNPQKQTSDIPFLTNDLGGFDMGKTNWPNEELYIRWMQFSMFNPITEVFSQPQNPTSNLAWKYSPRADSLFRFYSHLRMQLFPYLYSYAHQTRLKGENMIRKIPGQLYEFLLGNEFLVAPVYEKGAVNRKVFLPEGNWVNYWTGETFKGKMEHTVAAPLHQIPLFVRQGAIIPKRNYASSIEAGNNQTINLHVYPGGDGKFELIEDDGTSNDYLLNKFASTQIDLATTTKGFKLKINPAIGEYTGMKKTRKWIVYIYSQTLPVSITLNGRRLKFRYLKEENLIQIKAIQSDVNGSNEFEINMK